MLQLKTAIDLKMYSLMSLNVMGTAVGCDNHCQITVGNVQGDNFKIGQTLRFVQK